MRRYLYALLLALAPLSAVFGDGMVPLEGTYYFTFSTVAPSTGAPITMGGTPAIDVYEDGTSTPITTADTFSEDYNSVTGLHHVAIAATTANTFEEGKYYSCVIAGTSPTVDSVSVAGRVVGRFRVTTIATMANVTTAVEAAEVTLAADQSAVTALGGITVTGARMPSDVTYWNGSAVATPATAGYPAVTVKIGSGTGEFDLNGGYVKVVSFVDGAIEAADFAPNAIDASAIADNAIDAGAIAANAIGASEMASGAIVYGTELTGTVNASVLQWNGTNVGTPDAAGYPSVTIKQGSGTGEMDINGGYVKVVSFVDAAIEAADFAPGAINDAAIATDAITAAKIASNAIGAAEIANAAIDADTFSATGGFGPLGIIDQGTAQSATSTTLVLRSAAAFADDELIDASIVITGGSTGVGQVAKITDYVGSTDTATVDTWTTTPTGTITYQVIPSAGGDPTNWSAVQTQITTIEGDTGTDIPDLISAVDDKIDTIDGNVDDIETAADAILVDTGTTLPAAIAGIEVEAAAIPVNQVAVPENRTWKLKSTSAGLVDTTPIRVRVGESKIFAINFSVDLPTNGRITDFDSISIYAGTEGGVTFDTDGADTFGVDKQLAKLEITAVSAGSYELEATVTYTSDSGGGTAKALVTLVVDD